MRRGTAWFCVAMAGLMGMWACEGDGGGNEDLGPKTDLVADSPVDPGAENPGADAMGPDVPEVPDPGNGEDASAPPDNARDPGGTDIQPIEDSSLPQDGAALDPGGSDGMEDSGTNPDASGEDWPPSTPWWEKKKCLLPACDPQAPMELDLTGLWTQTLTAIRHDCNPVVETLKPEIKPGTVTTKKDQSFVVQGTCAYDRPGGVVTGVLKGDTMINCILMPPEQGVTAMPTGWLTFDGDQAAGKSTVHLYGIPLLQPTDCSIEYDVAYVRQ